jgi:hypothetical protein
MLGFAAACAWPCGQAVSTPARRKREVSRVIIARDSLLRFLALERELGRFDVGGRHQLLDAGDDVRVFRSHVALLTDVSTPSAASNAWISPK